MNRRPVCRCMTGWKDWTYLSVRLQTTGNTALRNHVNSGLISALRQGNLPALLHAEENEASNSANISDTARADVTSLAISHWLTVWLQSERHLFIFVQSTSSHIFSPLDIWCCVGTVNHRLQRGRKEEKKKQNICAWQRIQDRKPPCLLF